MTILPDWARARFDGWVNTLTGLGGANDKRLASLMQRGKVLSEAELGNMYRFDDLPRLIVEILPETAMAPGFELKIPDGEDIETKLQGRFEEMDAWGKLCEAFVWGRLYGGGALLLGVNDGQAVDKPLDLERVKSVDYLVPLDKRSLVQNTWYTDPTKPKFGEPETFRLRRQTNAQVVDISGNMGGQSFGAIIHESRMILCGGARTGDLERVANAGWDDSVLQAVYDVLRDFGVGWGGASLLLQEASQAIYGVKGLASMLASDQGEERLRKRFRMIEMGRSLARAMLIDADGETFERKATTFTGVPEMLDRFANRVAAAARIPVTVLMGQAPAGLNATGESDLRTWNATCERWRMTELKPAMELLVKLFLREQGAEPESWTLCWPPIYQSTPKETAEVEKLVAEKDAIYLQWGVLYPEEVAQSRYAAEGWSAETNIDLDLRKKMEVIQEKKVIAEAEQALETAVNPPEPGVDANGNPVASPGATGGDVPPGAPGGGGSPDRPVSATKKKPAA